jgi:hypothetical protein
MLQAGGAGTCDPSCVPWTRRPFVLFVFSFVFGVMYVRICAYRHIDIVFGSRQVDVGIAIFIDHPGDQRSWKEISGCIGGLGFVRARKGI